MATAIQPRSPAPDHLTEESYDPTDWAEFRKLAHRMVDDMLDHLRDLPVNHRSKTGDFESLVEEVIRQAEQICSQSSLDGTI